MPAHTAPQLERLRPVIRPRRTSARAAPAACLASMLVLVLPVPATAEPPRTKPDRASCALRTAPARLVDGPPPANVLALLGVLRRPAAPGDRALNLRDVPAGTIHRNHVRLLGVGPHGRRYYLVPGTEPVLRFSVPCKRRLPASQRRRLERLERASRRSPPEPLLLLEEVGRDSGSTSAMDVEQILENAVGSGCSGRACQRPFRSTVESVVPDGVAAVRLRFRGGLERTLPVTSNFWVTEVPIDFERSLPLSTVWLGPNGETIKEFGDAGI